jgi:hypothetical protein
MNWQLKIIIILLILLVCISIVFLRNNLVVPTSYDYISDYVPTPTIKEIEEIIVVEIVVEEEIIEEVEEEEIDPIFVVDEACLLKEKERAVIEYLYSEWSRMEGDHYLTLKYSLDNCDYDYTIAYEYVIMELDAMVNKYNIEGWTCDANEVYEERLTILELNCREYLKSVETRE